MLERAGRRTFSDWNSIAMNQGRRNVRLESEWRQGGRGATHSRPWWGVAVTKPTTALIVAVVLVIAAGLAAAGEYGSEAEAKALLERAVAALEADEARALQMFTTGAGGFVDRDLYVFCGGPDGVLTAHPYAVGVDLRAFRDAQGKPVGEEMYATAEEGVISKIAYRWPRPGGSAEPVDKVTFYTKVGDQICGVGYYPQYTEARAGGRRTSSSTERDAARASVVMTPRG
jgi:hypothetical protein